MKKLINTPDTVVADALAGMAVSHPDLLALDAEHATILRARPKGEGKVGLVSGGGSGHEPLHAGFVGAGMLDAACAGEVFTSPVPDQILAATTAVDRGAGVLHIVKNYSGDIMNFEMAADLAKEQGGTEVRTVVVDDDVAVEDSTYTAGRRGVAGTVLVEKIAGAAAEQGRTLDEVAAIAQRVVDGTKSMGIALTSPTLPAVGHPMIDLGADEVEFGIGIHGEPGRTRLPIATAAETARMLLDPILAELPGDGPAILLVNGMGATPLIELYVVAKEAAAVLDGAGIPIARTLVGNYTTSLDMAGCSLTVLRADDELLHLWDAPVDTPALRWGAAASEGHGSAAGAAGETAATTTPDAVADEPTAAAVSTGDVATTAASTTVGADGSIPAGALIAWIRRASALVSEHTADLNDLDSAIGDGDHGTNMTRGLAAAADALDSGALDTPEAVLKKVGMTLISKVGGASGPLYGTLFLRAASALPGAATADVHTLLAALQAGVDGVQERGKSAIGQKTMLDAWVPALDAFQRSAGDLGTALVAGLKAAEAGRDSTAPMVAQKGRASYLSERAVGHIDPGSASTALLWQAAVDTLTPQEGTAR